MHADSRLAAAFPACRDDRLAVSRLPLHDTRPLSLFLQIPDFFSDPHPDAAMASCLSCLRRGTTMLARPVSCRKVSAVDEYDALLGRNEPPVAQLLRPEQTEPYLMQVKDFQDADQ